MLDLIYFSNISENTHRFNATMKRFVEEQGETLETTRIPVKGELEHKPTNPYLLVCPSYGTEKTGHVPPQVKKFLQDEKTRNLCAGIIGSGNINFGNEFAAAGDRLSEKLGKPLLYRFELAGFDTDIQQIYRLLKMSPEQLTKGSTKE